MWLIKKNAFNMRIYDLLLKENKLVVIFEKCYVTCQCFNMFKSMKNCTNPKEYNFHGSSVIIVHSFLIPTSLKTVSVFLSVLRQSYEEQA